MSEMSPPATTAPTVPPMISASHFAVAMNVSEVMLGIGHSRMMLSVEPPNTKMQQVIEWAVSLAMSPTSAQSLHTMLGQMLMDYRQQFGEIPEDKMTTKRVTEGGSPLVSGAQLQ